MRITILAYEGCVASGISGFSDTLAVANHLAGKTLFATRTVSQGGTAVRCFSGTTLAVDGDLDSSPGEDWENHQAATGHDNVYIPPGFNTQRPTQRQRDWIARLHTSGTIVCAACAGVFFMAEAGLLDERPATTHWGLADEFTARYPHVRLEPEQMLIDGGDYICAGGITAYFDLALHLVVRFASSELAASCARTLLLDPGRTRQTPYMRLTGGCGTGDDAIDAALTWLDDNHTRPLQVGELAAAVHLGERTLLRRFKKATGRTPSGYLKALRVEHAKRLLESSSASVEEIVAAVGYRDTPSFFKLFKELTGLSPGGYRSRFGLFQRR
jgi:Transcriptional regulator containing an amidase domain and an AraC-type DNA-binding HTH domain